MKKYIKRLFVLLILLSLFTLSKTSNSQTTWFPINPGISNQLHWVEFVNPNTGYVVGNGIIIKTTNTGVNWIIQNPGTSEGLYASFFVEENIGYVVGGYYPVSIIRKTTNGGNNWYSQSSGMSIALLTVFFTDANTGYTGGDYGNILKTTNGGAIWFPQYTGTSNWIESINFINDNTGFASGRNGTILKTTDGGTIWTSKNSGTSNWLYSISFADANTGYCVGGTIYSPYDHIVLKTTNGGDNWLVKKSGTGYWLESFWLSGINSGIAVGSNGIILKTMDGGNTWTINSSGTSNLLTKVFFIDNNTGYISGYNGTLLKTTNGGLSSLIPILISPPNWSNGISLTPTLQWSSIMGVINYHVQVSRVSNFAVLTDSSTVTNNEYTIPEGVLTNTTTYFWRVNATDSSGSGPWSEIWNFSTLVTGIKKINSNIPEEFNLYQNYPNPFNPSTNIKFDIPNSSKVKLLVYDNLGKVIEELVNKKLSSGSYEVNWNGSNYASGIYYYRIETEEFINVKKMILMK